jgi:hypothetical protein
MAYGIKVADIKKAVENSENNFKVNSINTHVPMEITPNNQWVKLTIDVYLENNDAIKSCVHISKAK